MQNQIARNASFVRSLLNATSVDPDALLIATMRQLAENLGEEQYSSLVSSVQRNLMRELARDASRLMNILKYIGVNT